MLVDTLIRVHTHTYTYLHIRTLSPTILCLFRICASYARLQGLTERLLLVGINISDLIPKPFFKQTLLLLLLRIADWLVHPPPTTISSCLESRYNSVRCIWLGCIKVIAPYRLTPPSMLVPWIPSCRRRRCFGTVFPSFLFRLLMLPPSIIISLSYLRIFDLTRT